MNYKIILTINNKIITKIILKKNYNKYKSKEIQIYKILNLNLKVKEKVSNK